MSNEVKKEVTNNDRGGLFKIGQGVVTWVVAIIPVIYIACTISKDDSQYIRTFAISLALGIILYLSNDYLIPQFKDLLLKAGLSGKDLNKPGPKESKEAMYFIYMILDLSLWELYLALLSLLPVSSLNSSTPLLTKLYLQTHL
jgi:hypothetical protein